MLLSACKPFWISPELVSKLPPPEELQRDEILPPENGFNQVQTGESRRRNHINDVVHQLLMDGDFNTLEETARGFRLSRETYYDGCWALYSFYNGLSTIDDETPEAECQAELEKLKAWGKAKPESVTARIALADALSDYAWKARGTDWAANVPEQGFRLMQERLIDAWVALEEAKRLPTRCPHWWEVAQHVALGQGWNHEAYFALLEEAFSFEPAYLDYYSNAILYLQPRWQGQEGEAAKFIQDQADLRPGIDGDIMYARMIWSLDLRRLDQNVYLTDPNLSWSRTVRGFEELRRRYPHSLTVQSEYARLAYKARDKDRAVPLYREIGLRMDVRVWFDDYDVFRACRKWAVGE